ncbi:hypothetical protein ABW19_dt0205915 [Dactylella cylindrospora]|nr:hypothetical protein ABW19_dt0205915 [Dactylella cylindrospora]
MSSQSSGNSNDDNTNMPQRRGSITEYFRPPQPSAYPGPITTAAAQANHRRRMSYSGGLTGTSPTPAWFGSYGARRGSVGSISSTASSPIDNDTTNEEKSPVEGPSSGSFARRLSFGARALRDVKRSMSFGTVGEGEPENHHNEPSAPTQEAVAPPPPPPNTAVPKSGHDEVQERMLKGDFYF